MGTFNGVNINKLQGGLVRESDSSDRVVLLIIAATANVKLSHHTPVRLDALSDLEALGFTEKTDESTKELVYYHVSEFFRLSPERSLHLMLVPKTVKVSTLNSAEVLAGIRAVDGVNTIGVCSLTPDENITVAVTAAQLLVDALRGEHIYIDVILTEGVGTYLTDLNAAVNLRGLESENVAVVIAQDADIAKRNTTYRHHAAIGSALGMLSVRYVHENLGSVDIENHPRTAKGTSNYPLSSVKYGRWLNTSLSNGTAISAVPRTMQDKLNERGYIFAGSFQGYTGVFFSNACTCTEVTSDYAFIERNAVWNKAARLVRNTLLPRVRSKVKADAGTGYIAVTTIADWTSRVKAALNTMVAQENIADFSVYINPKQLAVSTKPFSIKVSLVADGIVHEFDVDLGLTNQV